MSRVKSFRFGPGRLESTELRIWAAPRRDEGLARVIKARAAGTYTVYCGNGWDHTVDFDEQYQFQLDGPGDDIDRNLTAAWKDSDEEAAYDAADELIEYALEDWFDPCETDDEEVGT